MSHQRLVEFYFKYIRNGNSLSGAFSGKKNPPRKSILLFLVKYFPASLCSDLKLC
jgi:hypothetical protein